MQAALLPRSLLKPANLPVQTDILRLVETVFIMQIPYIHRPRTDIAGKVRAVVSITPPNYLTLANLLQKQKNMPLIHFCRTATNLAAG